MSKIRKVSREDDLLVRSIYRATRLISRYFDVRLIGIEHIPPDQGVMLVGNHALMGIDAWALIPELVHQTGRIPRGLALRSLFRIPLISHTLRRVGMVKGERATAVELLMEGEMVLTYPGGVRDALRERSEFSQLEWAGRRGFAHVAAQAKVPVIPVVGVGPEACFHVLRDRGILPTRGLGSDGIRAPLFVPIAKRVPFDFHIGQAIHPPESLDDASIEAFALDVQAQTQALLDQGVAQRPMWLEARGKGG